MKIFFNLIRKENKMKKGYLMIMLVSLLMTCLSGVAEAEIILQPVAASTNMGEYFPIINIINQSGLSNGYTSLVTDFDSYIASNPTAFHGVGSNVWGAPSGVRAGFIDLDLGGSYVIDKLALWNLVDDPSAIQQFNLLVDDNSAFSSPANLGNFIASNSLGSRPDTEAQVFGLAATTASFARLEILNTWSPSSFSVAFNEAAFGVTAVNGPVPEPTTMLLVGSGLLGLWGARKKFKK